MIFYYAPVEVRASVKVSTHPKTAMKTAVHRVLVNCVSFRWLMTSSNGATHGVTILLQPGPGRPVNRRTELWRVDNMMRMKYSTLNTRKANLRNARMAVDCM